MEKETILVTGGAGSFASFFVKEALKLNPRTIRLYDNSESRLVDMQRVFDNPKLRFMMGDIRDKDRLMQAMKGVDLVVHTAAVKHVPICEYNPGEAIRTNVLGSLNVVECALAYGVDKVMGISTDKAVHPINNYGATKLVMERLFSEAMSYSKTKYAVCRFGNFWNSDNNVFDVWQKQTLEGKPITVTDKDMSRYWINTDEAVRFTIECINRMQGGEIFIPLMPVRTLAEIVGQSYSDKDIKVTGVRRGEKLKEELYNEDEARYLQKFKDYMVIKLT